MYSIEFEKNGINKQISGFESVESAMDYAIDNGIEVYQITS